MRKRSGSRRPVCSPATGLHRTTHSPAIGLVLDLHRLCWKTGRRTSADRPMSLGLSASTRNLVYRTEPLRDRWRLRPVPERFGSSAFSVVTSIRAGSNRAGAAGTLVHGPSGQAGTGERPAPRFTPGRRCLRSPWCRPRRGSRGRVAARRGGAVTELDQRVHDDRPRDRCVPVRGQREVGQTWVVPVLLADLGCHPLSRPLPHFVGSVLVECCEFRFEVPTRSREAPRTRPSRRCRPGVCAAVRTKTCPSPSLAISPPPRSSDRWSEYAVG